MRADRYARDFPALQNYHDNVALPSDTTSVNLASHRAYLQSVVATPGITSSVVFDQEGGREYLKQKGVKDLKLYDNGWKIPLPRTMSGPVPRRDEHSDRQDNDGVQVPEQCGRQR